MSITVVLNIHKRLHVLGDQLTAIYAQSVKPAHIYILNNGNHEVDMKLLSKFPNVRTIDMNENTGVWPRFLMGIMTDSEYVAVFDDDTIPGTRWFENCLRQMAIKPALLGTIGVIFRGGTEKYEIAQRWGWDGGCEEAKLVDMAGHAWFFRKEWLCYFTREPLPIKEMHTSGEDIHFSYVMQKYSNIPTMVPPHPLNDRSLWGSMPETAWLYGTDSNAISHQHDASEQFNRAYKHYRNAGFRIINDSDTLNVLTGDSRNHFEIIQRKILASNPFALIRLSDGEYKVIRDETVAIIDGIVFNKGGRLSKDLGAAAKKAITDPNVIVGFLCSTCSQDMYNWYMQNYPTLPSNRTYANLFVNANWENWILFLARNRIRFYYVGCGDKTHELLMVKGRIPINSQLVEMWDTVAEKEINRICEEVQKTRGELYLFSGGPVAKVLIMECWTRHPHNIYLDVGSSLDMFLKGVVSREYMLQGSKYSTEVCTDI